MEAARGVHARSPAIRRPRASPAADLAKKLFDAYDRFRLQDVYALLDRGLVEAEGRASSKEAIADFDEVLARQPMLDRRAEMAPAYVAYAESLEETDRPAALATLRKALRLDEAGPQSSHVRSEIDTLEGEDLLARGIADTEPFEQALALDPQNARARAELDRLHAELKRAAHADWRLLAAAAVLRGWRSAGSSSWAAEGSSSAQADEPAPRRADPRTVCLYSTFAPSVGAAAVAFLADFAFALAPPFFSGSRSALASSTSSMSEMGAPSPRRGPNFTMRV